MTTPFTARLAALAAAFGMTLALLAGAGHMQIPTGGASAVQLAQSAASSTQAG